MIIDSEPVSWHCKSCSGSKNHLFNIKTIAYTLCCDCGHITVLSEQVEKLKGEKL